MSQNAISIRGLRKTYAGTKSAPGKEALKGIDLDIPSGSIFGLLGPNGAGKSTLINILAGLVNKAAGQVEIWGFDQDKNPRQSRAAIDFHAAGTADRTAAGHAVGQCSILLPLDQIDAV